jgi:hypothetical protein
MVSILAGRIGRIDAMRRVIGIGRQEVWVPEHIEMTELVETHLVSAVCEERDGRYWVLSYRKGLDPV